MSLNCQKIEIKKLPFYASDITNFTSAVCAVVLEMSVFGGEPLFESWAATYSGDLYDTFTTVNTYSATWGGGGDSNVNTFVYSNSANILQSNSVVNFTSGNWNSVYNSYNSSSASFLTISSANSRFVELSGDVMTGGLSAPSLSTNNLYVAGSTINFFDGTGSVIETLKSNDVGNFKSNYTLTNSRSANWENTYNGFSSQSANNISVYSNVNSNSGNWNYQGTDIKSLTSNWQASYTALTSTSANWNDTRNTVQTNSATLWNYQGTDIKSLTSNWQNTYIGFSSQSANNISVYNNVNSNSATNWNYQGNDIKTLTANWQNTYSTVSSYSATWGRQTLSFNESNAQLTISDGNTVSLSSLSGGNGSSGVSYLSALNDVYIPSPANGQVLTYSSVLQKWTTGSPASASGQTGYYGSFYDTTVQTLTGTNQAKRLDIADTFEANGISLSSNKIVFNNIGTYEIIFSIQYKNTSQDQEDIYVWFRKNGVDVPDSSSVFTIPARKNASIPAQLIAVTPFIATLAANDFIEIYWHCNATAVTVETFTTHTNPTIPDTPGVIITVKQVTNVQLVPTVGAYLPLSGGTVTGVLSTTNVIYASGGNSIQWNSSYTTVNTNSASWGSGGGGGSGPYLPLSGGTMDNGAIISFDNYSRIRQNPNGTENGIDLVCSIDYVHRWKDGFLYIYDQSNQIRTVYYGRDLIPSVNYDLSQGYIIGSIYVQDNGNSYICIDNSVGAAVWEIWNTVGDYLPLSGGTLTGAVSTTDVLYTSGGDSNQWNSTYTNFSFQSANNISVYSTVASNSATWGGGGSGGGGALYYFNQATLAQSPTTNLPITAHQLGRLGLSAQTTYTSPHISQVNYDLVAGFVTNVLDPNIDAIPGGIWDFNIWAYSNANVNNPTVLQALVYTYDGTNAPVLLSTSDNTTLTDTGIFIQHPMSCLVPQTSALLSTRIYVEFRAKASASNKTVTLAFGDSTPSHIHTTIPSVGGTGLVKVIDGVIQTPASLLIDADVSASANIAQSKINGLVDITNKTNSTYNTVNSYSATTWNYQGTDIKALTGNWQNTYVSFSSQSANNLSVYNTVQTYSATTWNPAGNYLPLSGGTMNGSLDVATGQILSGGVNINTLWGGGGGGSQTLSFNEVNDNLTISSGNTVTLSALRSVANVYTITTNGTWINPSPTVARPVTIILVGGGGGGGGGRAANDSTSAKGGGGGGAGGALVMFNTWTNLLSTTESIIVGAGGTGGTRGVAVSGGGSGGGNGVSGGQTSMTLSGTTLKAVGGALGNNGTTTVAAGGSPVTNASVCFNNVANSVGGGIGQAGAANGSVGAAATYFIPTGGGGGAGVNSTNNNATFITGGIGGILFASGTLNQFGSSAGSGHGASGGDGFNYLGVGLGGAGGNASYATPGQNGGNGGNGGLPGGGGGGGGGYGYPIVTPFTPASGGLGGNGGNGVATIIVY